MQKVMWLNQNKKKRPTMKGIDTFERPIFEYFAILIAEFAVYLSRSSLLIRLYSTTSKQQI